MSAFEDETAVEEQGAGSFSARVHPGWWVVRGPHGGYLAAIILRALTAVVGDPARPPRSFTTHFAAAPTEGPLSIDATIERRGRSMTTVSARTTQEGKLVALSLAAYSAARDGLAFDDAPMPDAGSPGDGMPIPREGEGIPPFLGNFDMRWLFGRAPFSGADEAVVGGWLRLRDAGVADAPAVACLLDSWAPAVFPRATAPVVCPTVDLTIHFRRTLPLDAARPDDFFVGRFTSSLAHDGFFEEDGALWSSDGLLIAQSRQLALALSR